MNLIDTPYLGPEWEHRKGMLGKMRDKDFAYYSCSDEHFTHRLELEVVTDADKAQVYEIYNLIAKVFENYQCEIHVKGSHSILTCRWDSYQQCQAALQSYEFMEMLNAVECNMSVIHQSQSGDIYREYIRFQIDPARRVLTYEDEKPKKRFRVDIQALVTLLETEMGECL